MKKISELFGKKAKMAGTFDLDKQYAVIRSSICTGEKVAGFKDKESGHFIEVMVIRNAADEQEFKRLYNVESFKVEY